MDIDEVLDLYAAGVLDEDEVKICFMPMYETRFFTNRGLKLNALTADQCTQSFRFQPDHLLSLADVLLFPKTVILEDRPSVTGLEVLWVVLRRLAYPNRFSDLE